MELNEETVGKSFNEKISQKMTKLTYSTFQGFFYQPAYPRGEGATIKRISPPRKPQAGGGGGVAADPRRFRGGFYR